jgi:hypothetical protein
MADLYTGLDNLANDAKEWKCKLLFNQTVFNQGDEGAEDVDIVDLCEFLPFINLRGRKENKDYPPGTNYMFPERFKGLGGKGLLLVELKLAAIQCGYSLAIRSSKVETNDKSDRAFSCCLTCIHGKIYSKNSSNQKSHQKTTVASERDGASEKSGAPNMGGKTKGKTKKKTKIRKATYKTTTKRPTDKQCLCPFKIKLFLQKESAAKWPGRWFLCGEMGPCCQHRFHFELEPGHLHVPIELMTEEEKALAKDCSQLYFAASSSANLLSLRTKTSLNFQHWTQQGKPPIRGKDVRPVSAEDHDDILGQGGSDSDNQSDDVRVLTQSSDHKYQVVVGKVQNLLKLIEDDPVAYQTLLDALDRMTMRAVAAQAAVSKDDG